MSADYLDRLDEIVIKKSTDDLISILNLLFMYESQHKAIRAVSRAFCIESKKRLSLHERKQAIQAIIDLNTIKKRYLVIFLSVCTELNIISKTDIKNWFNVLEVTVIRKRRTTKSMIRKFLPNWMISQLKKILT